VSHYVYIFLKIEKKSTLSSYDNVLIHFYNTFSDIYANKICWFENIIKFKSFDKKDCAELKGDRLFLTDLILLIYVTQVM